MKRPIAACSTYLALGVVAMLGACDPGQTPAPDEGGNSARPSMTGTPTDPAFPPVVPRSEPYNTAPGTAGTVEIKNTFDHAVLVSIREVGDNERCPGAVAPQPITLQPNEIHERRIGEERKLCFSMGADLSEPLLVGICEARSRDRVALAAYLGCYRRS